MKGNVSMSKGGGSGVSVVDGKVFVKDGDVNIELVQAYKTYGVSVDLSNSNPETAVTYTDDAVGMVAGSSDWYKMSIFNKIKPCLFKDGAVVGYLNPDNFAQFADGSAADISSGDSGDVMIEIPKIGYKISKSGTTLTVQITDDPNKNGFSYKAHTRTEEGDREKLYVGAFFGFNMDGKLRSLSGVWPLGTFVKMNNFRTYAQANGAGYDLLSFYPLTLLQCLYLIMYKNLNSQEAIGMGYVGDVEYLHYHYNTGVTVDKGMNYGTSDNFERMKFLGIEDFWGNLNHFIDGIISNSDYHVLVATENFNENGNGYTDIGAVSTSNLLGYMKEPQGNNDLGFIPATVGGSSSTYFSDRCRFLGDCVPEFGGFYGSDTEAGAFYLTFARSKDSERDDIGGRLMFL